MDGCHPSRLDCIRLHNKFIHVVVHITFVFNLKIDEYHPAMGVVLVCFDPFLGFHSMKAHSHPQPLPVQAHMICPSRFSEDLSASDPVCVSLFWLSPDGNKKNKKTLWW
jgi:hypothetical protein